MSLYRLVKPATRCLSARALLLSCLLLSANAFAAGSLALGINGANYLVELANTPELRARGLMFRRGLAPDGGMLLSYPRSGNHLIWMKNMSIALRVYWIDSDHVVVDAKRLEPCQADPCPVYAPSRASQFVLELQDREHGIKPGDRVEGLEKLRP